MEVKPAMVIDDAGAAVSVGRGWRGLVWQLYVGLMGRDALSMDEWLLLLALGGFLRDGVFLALVCPLGAVHAGHLLLGFMWSCLLLMLMGGVVGPVHNGRGWRLDLGCWRRLALIVGAALAAYPLRSLEEAVVEARREGGDLFRGLVEAVRPCGVDGLLLEGGELTRFAVMALLQPGFYMAYADVYGDVEEELRGLSEKWEVRGGYVYAEALYALGLSVLLAGARLAGRGVSAEAAETALRLSSVGIYLIADPQGVDNVVRLLSPLRDLSLGGWVGLLFSAVQVGATGRVVRELGGVYERVLGGGEDWVRARLAVAYARVRDVERAGELLNRVGDEALRVVAEAYAYNYVVHGGYPLEVLCERLGEVYKALRGLVEEASSSPGRVLSVHPALGDYLRWHYVGRPVEALNRALREALSFALSGLARCRLENGVFGEAEELFSEAAAVSRGLEFVNYLVNRGWALRARALRGEDVVGGFRGLWEEVLGSWRPTARYLGVAAHVLGNYLVSLALAGRREEALRLLREFGSFPGLGERLGVVVYLVLRVLGVDVDVPSAVDVFNAVRGYVQPRLLPALAEVLGAPMEGALDWCRGLEGGDSVFCLDAYSAVRGDEELSVKVGEELRGYLVRRGVPRDLLVGVGVRQLVELAAPAAAPAASSARFTLLLRALARGDVALARLHAEVGRVVYGRLLGRLYEGLVEALAGGDWGAVGLAVARLYYYYF